jgi:hypothetical protein
MDYIDQIGNDLHIIYSNAPVNSYDFVDQSDTFKYVIATTVANLVRNYNSKTDSEIVFGHCRIEVQDRSCNKH